MVMLRKLYLAKRGLFGFASPDGPLLGLVARQKRALARAQEVRRRDAADRLFWVHQPGALPLWGAWAEWVSDLHRV